MPKAAAAAKKKSAKSAKSKSSKSAKSEKDNGGEDDPSSAEVGGSQHEASGAADSPMPPTPGPVSHLVGYSRIDAAIDSTHTLGQALEQYGYNKEK